MMRAKPQNIRRATLKTLLKSVLGFSLVRSSSTAVPNKPPDQKMGSFCRDRKALYFWSLGISLYLELFSFPSFNSFVLRNMYTGTHRRNQNMPYITDFTLVQS